MKSFFAGFFGTIAAIVLVFIVLIIIVFAAIPDEKTVDVKTNSVLKLTLNGEIPERSSKNPFEGFEVDGQSGATGLKEILECIEKAKNDENIKGIYLELSGISAGFATVEEIRNALLDFRSSKKFIISYGEIYTQKAYYLATAADKIYLNPNGIIEFKGLSAQIMFYKGLFDKLEAEVQVFKHGKFKSAVEPFIFDKMSDANREQVNTYIGSLWNHVLDGIEQTRGIPVADLNKYADNMSIQNPAACMTYKFADDTLYHDQVLDVIREKIKIGKKDEINFIALKKYAKVPAKKTIDIKQKNKIAVIYCKGSIESGEGDENTIGSEGISKAIKEARLDSNVKAIVLRVNSPGGSALASDVIWREVVLAQQEKPVIVSMGDVAASGGYYISCAADYIFAQPNTITGSIGVFGLLPNLQNFYKNKLGITFDTANTNRHSDIGTLNRPVTEEERVVIQKGVEIIYQQFIKRVADGRKKTTAEIDSIGQGRVWSGSDALQIGLVDQLGGIKDAIKYAVEKAKLKEYKLIYLPKQKEPLEEFMKKLNGEESAALAIKKELGEQYIYYKQLQEIFKFKGVQARLPFEMILY